MSLDDGERYLATTLRPLLAVHSSYSMFARALHLNRQNSLSWYDSLIVAAALESQCEILYSEDFQDRQRFGELKVVNPFR
jgi:predicted nucleic acid-binding protein